MSFKFRTLSAFISGASLGVLLAASSTAALAQTSAYPTRPITIVANSEAGGATDIIARAVQEALRTALGNDTTIVIDPQSAAGGIVGADKVARSKPDGYTLLVSGTGPMIFSPLLTTTVPYNVPRDFIPIVLMATAPNLLVANPKLGVNTLSELIALAKRRPGEITFASSGIGNPSHLTGELFKQLAGVNMLHVPYRGSRAAASAVLAGEVDVMFSPPSATIPFTQDGRLRAIAVTAPERMALAPTVPTSAEAGMPDLTVLGWFGFFAPAGTPPAIVDKLTAAMNTALNDPKSREMISRSGFDAVAKSDPQSFGRYMQAERVRWKKVIDTTGIKLE